MGGSSRTRRWAATRASMPVTPGQPKSLRGKSQSAALEHDGLERAQTEAERRRFAGSNPASAPRAKDRLPNSMPRPDLPSSKSADLPSTKPKVTGSNPVGRALQRRWIPLNGAESCSPGDIGVIQSKTPSLSSSRIGLSLKRAHQRAGEGSMVRRTITVSTLWGEDQPLVRVQNALRNGHERNSALVLHVERPRPQM